MHTLNFFWDLVSRNNLFFLMDLVKNNLNFSENFHKCSNTYPNPHLLKFAKLNYHRKLKNKII